MGREFVSAVLGLVVGVVLTGFLETINHLIFPAPPGIDYQNPAQLAAIIETSPFLAKLGILVAWTVGIFAGGATAIRISNGLARPAYAVAALLYLGATYTMIIIPHPLWMVIGATVLSLAAGLGVVRIFATPARV